MTTTSTTKMTEFAEDPGCFPNDAELQIDWIKTLATERAGTPDTDPRKQVYSQEELRILVVEAGSKNIPVMAHAHGAEGAAIEFLVERA